MFHICPYVYILRLYVLYEYVQRCEDTVSVELRYINSIYDYDYYYYYIIIIIIIIVIIIIIIISIIIIVVVIASIIIIISSIIINIWPCGDNNTAAESSPHTGASTCACTFARACARLCVRACTRLCQYSSQPYGSTTAANKSSV